VDTLRFRQPKLYGRDDQLAQRAGLVSDLCNACSEWLFRVRAEARWGGAGPAHSVVAP
jgi:hypothetical protein